MILNRLGPRIWQHINVEKHSDLFYLVVLHPAFLKEVKSLPGYIGQDREVGEGCTVSCYQRVNNKDSAESRSEKFVLILYYTFRKKSMFRFTRSENRAESSLVDG